MYRKFKFISCEKVKSSAYLPKYVVKGTVERVTKTIFRREKVEVVGVYLYDSAYWRFEDSGDWTPKIVDNLIQLWEIKNKTKLESCVSLI